MKTLLCSKRFLVALTGVSFEVLIHFGVDLESEVRENMQQAILLLVSVLIGGYSLTDASKALHLPPGVGHKDC